MKGNFQSIINGSVPVLVDFYADWCQPCKIQAPILLEFAKEAADKVKVIKIDVDKNPEVAMKYQIQGVPTLALFKNGSIVWRQSGVVQKQGLLQVVNTYT
ncbi:MAG: thioredoxin [Bacteroidota bacterium]